MNSFHVGDTIVCKRNVKNSDGDYVNPAVSMKIRVAQVLPYYDVVLAATSMGSPSPAGHYSYNLDTSNYLAGTYEAKFIAVDTNTSTTYKEAFLLKE